MMILFSSLLARIAGAILLCPPDVIEGHLPVVPSFPVSWEELDRRSLINDLLDQCWEDGDGFEVAISEERILNNGGSESSSSSLLPSTYGEVTYRGARQLFEQMGMPKIKMTSTERTTTPSLEFFDLGSGAGKLVAQAYLELDVKRVVGIELGPSRHQAALQAKAKLTEQLQLKEQNAKLGKLLAASSTASTEKQLVFLQDDLFQANLSQTTHIYVSSLCFTPDMLHRLEEKLFFQKEKEAPKLECVASLQKFPNLSKSTILLPTPQVHYIEMSWTKPKGAAVYFYFFRP